MPDKGTTNAMSLVTLLHEKFRANGKVYGI